MSSWYKLSRLVLHGGLSKQPVTYPPCAALTSAVAAGRSWPYVVCGSRRGKLLIFKGLLERTYMVKELPLKLSAIDIAT